MSRLSQSTLLQGPTIHLAHVPRCLHSSCSGGLGGGHPHLSTILLHCTTRVREPR